MVRANIDKGVPLNLGFLRQYGVKPGMILSLIWDWQQKSDDGWVIITQDDVARLGFTPDQFRTIKRKLIKLNVIEEKTVGRNQRAYRIRK
jgi:hypothetical protein